MSWYLYIIQSEIKETYYIGITNDLDRRLYFHNNSHKGHTRRYRPWKLVYSRSFDSKELALASERKVKGWKSKKMIRLLVAGKIII